MTKEERLQALAENRDPSLRMNKILTDRAIAEAILKMSSIKGDKGDKGDTPIKGVDYYTPEEIDAIINFIQDQVKDGKDGKDGKNGNDGKDGQTPVRGVDYWTEQDRAKIITDVLKKIKPAKDGVSPKVEDIVNLVLKEIKLPDTKDLISREELVKFLQRGGFRGGGDTISAGSGVTITVVDGIKQISTPYAKGFINHGSTAGTARPTGYTSVEWWGTVQPSNMAVGDTWINTA